MTFLTNTVANLEFNPMAFVENLRHMGCKEYRDS